MQKTNYKLIEVLGEEQLNLYFAYLDQCTGVEQNKKYHPEGDVLNHSLQCLCWALKESTDIDLILAAMLHDIGKIEKSKGHENVSVKWLQGICSVKTLWLIENHIRIWYLILGDMRRYKKVRELANHCWLPELIMLARWDRLARNPAKVVKYDKNKFINCLKKKMAFKYGLATGGDNNGGTRN
jgi:hypothetical protein